MVSQIERVLIYAGHKLDNYETHKNEFDKSAVDCVDEPTILHMGKGPYADSVQAHLHMFWQVNKLYHDSKWLIQIIYGEQFTSDLMAIAPNLSKTILVIPAGKSTDLDVVFTEDQIKCIRTAISINGLNYFASCGSAYWSCTVRHYETPERMIEKHGRINLYNGLGLGPASPDSMKYGADFFHEAVTVYTTDDIKSTSVTLLLSGGGTFVASKSTPTDILLVDQAKNTEVIAKYSKEFLDKHNKNQDLWEAAAIKTKLGEGIIVLAMPNPAYAKVDPLVYKQSFPDRKEDWNVLNSKVSSFEERMDYSAAIFAHFEKPSSKTD